MEELLQKFLIKNYYMNLKFFTFIAGAYLLSIAEIENSVLQIGTGALHILNTYISGIIQGNDWAIYLLDSYSKDKNDNSLSSGTVVLP